MHDEELLDDEEFPADDPSSLAELDPVTEELADEGLEEDDDDFDLDELDELVEDLPVQLDYVTFRSTSGQPITVDVEQPASIINLLARVQLEPRQGTEFWMGGVSVPYETEVGPGAVVTIVGSVKGA